MKSLHVHTYSILKGNTDKGTKYSSNKTECSHMTLLVNTHIVQLEADNDTANDKVGTADWVGTLQAKDVTREREKEGETNSDLLLVGQSTLRKHSLVSTTRANQVTIGCTPQLINHITFPYHFRAGTSKVHKG